MSPWIPKASWGVRSNCPFKWVTSSLKYMGIWLTPNLANLYTQNFHPILFKLKQDLQNWRLKPFSWFRRAVVVKMTVLPRVLYLFHNLPILLLKGFFSRLNTMIREFIWAGKKSCISMQTLTKPKTEGGINLPNFKHYYYATHLVRILDWNCHEKAKDWVGIEGMETKIPLWFLP